MESLFGVPIGPLTVALTIVFVLALAITAFFALRNPVMLKMALRNIPRRRAQTVLIVLGLMLATLLFSASFATGDTLTRSFRAAAVQQLGLLDVRVHSDELDASGAPVPIPQETADAVRAAVADAPVDAVAPVLSVHAPAISPASGRNVPVLAVLGLDPAHADDFGAYLDADGRALSVGGLSAGEALLSDDAATELRAAPGDEFAVYLGRTPASIRIAGVFEEGGSSHSPAPRAVMRLADAQELLGEPGNITYVYLSLDGDAIAGGTSEANEEAALDAFLEYREANGLDALAVKGDAIEAADQAGAQVANFFLLFGAFSIMAGILLIALIFVMLAAERKRELGIARAVAAQRGHVVRLFTFEGAVYSLLAAAVGSGLGVVVGLLMVRIMAAAFGTAIEGLTITFSFRWQSLLLAYTLGMVSTYVVVVVSAWRVSALNIVRAVRDIPEPPHEGHRIGEWWRGACVPYAAGWRALLRFHVHQTLALWLFAGPWAFAKLAGALFMSGYLMTLLGVWLVNGGIQSEQEWSFLSGLSFVCVGVPFALRHAFRIPERLAYTVAGVLLVALWIRDWNWQAFGVPELEAGIQLFIVSAMALVIGAIWIVMYNATFLAGAVTRVMGRGALSPVIRTAVAYPMASRFRTGMTLAMFSLVIFTLSVVAFISEAFGAAFSDTRRASGGFDVAASVSPANPISDIGARIDASPNLDRSDFAAIGGLGGLPVRIRQADTDQEEQDWYVTGVDRAYADYTGHGFSQTDGRYATNRDIWLALAGEENAVVVRSTLIPGAGGPGGPQLPFQLEGVSENDDPLPEVYVEIAAHSGETARFRVIGVIDDGSVFSGDFADVDGVGVTIIAGQQALAQLTGTDLPLAGYDFALSDPSRADDLAIALEDEFVENGLDATDLGAALRTANSATTTFFRLLQGFMGLGLVVGIAALGVIAARSVVERRVQIGVLRAVGFRAGMVQFAFLLESSFIALLGIAVGLALGFGLSADIVNEIGETTPGVSFRIPWTTIAVVVVVGFLASLLTTYLPARQASRIYPAEALRSDE